MPRLAQRPRKRSSIIFKSQVLADTLMASVLSCIQVALKEDPGNYRPVNLTSVPSKIMENIILKGI